MFHNRRVGLGPPMEEEEERLRYQEFGCRPTCKGVEGEDLRLEYSHNGCRSTCKGVKEEDLIFGYSHHDCRPTCNGVNSAQEQSLEDHQYGGIYGRNKNSHPPNLPLEGCPTIMGQIQHQIHFLPELKKDKPGLPTIEKKENKEEVEGLPTIEETDDTEVVNKPERPYLDSFLSWDTSDAEQEEPLEIDVQNTQTAPGDSKEIEKNLISENRENPDLMVLILPSNPETLRAANKEDIHNVQNRSIEDTLNTAGMYRGSISSSLRDESTQTSAENWKQISNSEVGSMAGIFRNDSDTIRRSIPLTGERNFSSERNVADSPVPSNTALLNAMDYSSASLDDLHNEQKPRPSMSRQRSTYNFSKILGEDNKWAKAMDAFQKSLIENERKQETISMTSNRRESDQKKTESYHKSTDNSPKRRISSRDFEALLSGGGSFVQDTYTSLHLHSNTTNHRDSNTSYRDAKSCDKQERHSSLGLVSEYSSYPRPQGPSNQSRICTSGRLCNVKARVFRECIKQSQMKIPLCTETDTARYVPDIQDLDDFPITLKMTVPCPLQVGGYIDCNTGSQTSKRKTSIPTIMDHIDEEPTPPPKTNYCQRKRASKAKFRSVKRESQQIKDPPPPSVFMYGREYKLVDQEPQTSSEVAPNATNVSQGMQVPSNLTVPECCIQKINSKPPTPDEEGYRSGNDRRDPRDLSYGNPYLRIDPYGIEDPGRPYESYGHQPYGYGSQRRPPHGSFGSY